MLKNYEEIITVEDLQDILYIGRNKAYNLVKSGELYAFKVGATWRIPLASVKAYIGYNPTHTKTKFTI